MGSVCASLPDAEKALVLGALADRGRSAGSKARFLLLSGNRLARTRTSVRNLHGGGHAGRDSGNRSGGARRDLRHLLAGATPRCRPSKGPQCAPRGQRSAGFRGSSQSGAYEVGPLEGEERGGVHGRRPFLLGAPHPPRYPLRWASGPRPSLLGEGPPNPAPFSQCSNPEGDAELETSDRYGGGVCRMSS